MIDNIQLTAALVACGILTGLTVFQIALIAGAPIGRFAWGGQHQVLPVNLRLASVTSIVLYLAFGAVILDNAGVIAMMPDTFSQPGAWILTAYFAVGIGLNALSRSKPERSVMTPLAAALALTCAVVALR